MTLDLQRRCERCWGLPYCDYISILLPGLRLQSLFSTSSDFYLLIRNCLISISHPQTQNYSQRDFTITSLPSPRAFSSMMMMMRENMTPDYGRPHKKKLAEAKTQPQHKHTQTNFDIQIRLSVTNVHRYAPQWAAQSGGGVGVCDADLTIHGDATKECHIRKLLMFCLVLCENGKHLLNMSACSKGPCSSIVYRVMWKVTL